MDGESQRKEEQRLVAACIAGEEAAWRDLIARYAPLLAAQISKAYRRVRGRGPSPEEAEELSQEILLGLFRNQARGLRNFRWECSLPTYLAVAATREALARLRGESRGAARLRRPLDAEAIGEAFPSSALAPDEALAAAEEAETVRAWVADLAVRDRLAVRLYFWEGLAPREIAARMGKDPTHVCVILHRAIEKLRKKTGNTR